MSTEGMDIGFVLQGIKTEQFAVFEENYSPRKEVGLSIGLQFKVDNQNKQVGVFLGFEFIQTKKVFLKIQVSCHFKIAEAAWHSFKQEDKLLISKGFLAHLAMIASGTARGILFAKTESTPFSSYIIPAINVADMIKEDAEFELAEN